MVMTISYSARYKYQRKNAFEYRKSSTTIPQLPQARIFLETMSSPTVLIVSSSLNCLYYKSTRTDQRFLRRVEPVPLVWSSHYLCKRTGSLSESLIRNFIRGSVNVAQVFLSVTFDCSKTRIVCLPYVVHLASHPRGAQDPWNLRRYSGSFNASPSYEAIRSYRWLQALENLSNDPFGRPYT